MRISKGLASIGLVGLALAIGPASGFDGTPTVDTTRGPTLQSREPARIVTPPAAATITPSAAPGAPRPPAAVPQSGPARAAVPPGAFKSLAPSEAMRSGAQLLREGRAEQAVTAFEYAAEQGMPSAIWMLGRMYAEGEGVDQNKLRAFEYFKNLTKTYADDPPGTQQARYVASAFVSLGHFYLEGIPDTYVKVDAVVAREMFHYAASYYAHPEAQYQLGRLYFDGMGTAKDYKQAVRWFKSASDKGLRRAQAMLGSMLFKGQGVARQAPLGLAWLTVAKEGARPDEAWISDAYKSAMAQATLDERALAGRFLEDIVKPRRR